MRGASSSKRTAENWAEAMKPGVTPESFSVQVPEEVLDELRGRLTRIRWPDEIPESGWQFGVDLSYIKELVAYWRDRYDWRAHEAKLNQFQQFTAPVAAIDLHFVHQPGVGP